MDDLVAIASKKTLSRVILASCMIAAVAFAWFAVSRQMGSMIASLAKSTDPDAASAAELAVSLAPMDPAVRWLSGTIAVDGASPDLDAAVLAFEEAVRLSPNDYQWRIELGRALEHVDKPDLAEAQLRKAVELAPEYAFPRWHLGNFYLRQDRTAEAFDQLRKAAQDNRTYREQVFSLAWDYFNKDPKMVEQLAADTPDARAGLALFFAGRGEAGESLRIWNLLSESEKAANPEIAKGIAQGLYIQRHFPEALEFARQLGIDAEARSEAITNAGFERGVASQPDARFDWVISRNDAKLDITSDSGVFHSGKRSMRASFRNFVKPEFYNIYQTVAVEPNKSYRLTFWVRTENLKTAGPPLLQIINGNDDKLIAESKPFQTGTNEWQEYQVDIRTPDNCRGINVRTSRQFCGDQCPIIGTFWYDDFALTERTGN
jgi:hypothetical protein